MASTLVVGSQVINKILQTKDFKFVEDNGLDETYFVGFEKEFNFIEEHYKKHGNIPDVMTFLEHFQDFGLYEVNETDDYLLERLYEEKGYTDIRPFLNEANNLLKEDSRLAYNYIVDNIGKVKPLSKITGTDIIKNAEERLKHDELAKTVPISTGLKELDDIFNGGLNAGEELVTIVGRTGGGKSWLCMGTLTSAHEQGKTVGLYSGEMSAIALGYRYDTLFRHFSNRLLLKGLYPENYIDYINALKDSKTPFIIATQKEFGGRPTVQKIRNFVEYNNIEVLGIDQYSLMEDSRAKSNDPYRLRLGHITEDLFALSCECKIPIIGLAQANRDATKKNNSVPALEDIKESDDISHNSTRCIGLSNNNGRLLLDVIKNRYGKSDCRLMYNWQIDNGYFEYVPSDEDGVNDEIKNQIIQDNKQKYEIPKDKNPF